MKHFVTLFFLFKLFCALTDAKFLQTVLKTFSCGDQAYYTEDNGEIISHSGFNKGRNYGKSLRCLWVIEAPEGMHVQLMADTFNLQMDSLCYNDYLELFDGNSTSSPKLGRYCGDEFGRITSSQRYLTLLFDTDTTQQMAGFKLLYSFTTDWYYECPDDTWRCSNGKCIPLSFLCDKEDDCGDYGDEEECHECRDGRFNCSDGLECVPQEWICDTDLDCDDGSDELGCSFTTVPGSVPCPGPMYRNETAGNVTSGAYPEEYPSNQHCVYTIDIGQDYSAISFYFFGFYQLEESDNCRYDNLTITGDDIDGTEQKYGPYCGPYLPHDFNVTGSSAEVVFRSDTSVNKLGFMLAWRAIS